MSAPVLVEVNVRMQIRIAVCVAAIAAMALNACSSNDPVHRSAGGLFAGNPLAPIQATSVRPDTIPVHNPPPPPSPPQRVTLQFAGADTVPAGGSSSTRWQFANSGHASVTVAWTLGNGHGWPGFPKQGTLALAPLSTQLLTVAVAVPDTAQSGSCPLHMTAIPPHGPVVSADGAIQVSGASPPPDSLVAGSR